MIFMIRETKTHILVGKISEHHHRHIVGEDHEKRECLWHIS